MAGHSQTDTFRKCGRVARALALVVLAWGGVALSGWLLGIPVLMTGLPGLVPMNPLTALCFIIAGIALLLSSRSLAEGRDDETPAGARAAAVIVIAICALVLAQRIPGLNFGMSAGLQVLQGNAMKAGVMAAASAFGLICVAVALLLQDLRPRVAEVCALLALIIGLFRCFEFLYGGPALGVVPDFATVSLPTAVLLVLAGAGALICRPRHRLVAAVLSEHSGGMLARRALPICLVVPPLLGYIRLLGQRAGLFDPQLGLALFATAAACVFSGMVVWNAIPLNRVDAENQAAEEQIRRTAGDLSEANQQLKASEERFALFMRHLPAIAFLKDDCGRYTWGNAAWWSSFPPGAGDPRGKTDSELFGPAIAAEFEAADQAVINQEGPLQNVQWEEPGGDGRHWVISKFPVQTSDGKIHIGGIALDITESKRIEKQLYSAQKLEAIGLLAGGVAHDFNNLLTVIIGYSDIAQANASAGESPAECLREIQKAAKHAALLTSQLLAFGRKQTMQPRMVNLNEIVLDIESMLRRVVEKYSLMFALDADLGVVKADTVQVQQVLLNLVMNARDAVSGAGEISVVTSNEIVSEGEYSEIPPGNYVVLNVYDNGQGMDAATLARIFEPFFSTKEAGKGTGLGLATVYGIVRQSGGYIQVDSEVGLGSSFRVFFPRMDPVESVAGPLNTPPVRYDSANAGQTILVVEDEDSVRALIVRTCSRAGYRVVQASSGEQAIGLVEAHPGSIDLMITDVVMPGMSGAALAAQVSAIRPETGILYCSGYAGSALARHGVLESGVNLLPKPFTSGVLIARIREVLNAREIE